MEKNKILEIIDEMIEKTKLEEIKVKSEAYTVRLTDDFAIYLRDKLFELEGIHKTLIIIRNKIVDLED